MAPASSRAMEYLTLPSRVLARGMVRWIVEVVLPRPREVIAACVAVILLCAAGVHRLELATATDQLWVPQETAVMHNRERVRALFGSQPQWQSVIVTPEGGGSDDDALAASVVDALFALEAKIEAIPGWQDACYRLRANQPCVRSSVTALWCDYDAFAAEVLASDDPVSRKNAILARVNGGGDSCSFGPLERLRVLGAPSYDDGSTFESATSASTIVAARSVYGAYLLDMDKGEDAARAVAEKFEALMKAESTRLAASAGTTNTRTVANVTTSTSAPPLTVDFAYSLAFDKEIGRSVTGDIPLVAAAFTAISIATSLSQWFVKKPDVSFATAANWGVFTVALGVATGYGVVIWCGVKFTSLAQIGPFIFLGVGVDDIVVLLEAFRLARETIQDGGSVRQRFEFVAERAGVSIAITSFTNFLAFALGSMTVIPAVHWFCLYASVTILCDFFIVSSLFVAILALREAADQTNGAPKRAFDAAAAETRPLPPSETEAQRARRRDLARRLAEADEKKTTTKNADDAKAAVSDGGVFHRAVRGYSEFLMRTPVRVAVIVVFIGYGAFGLAQTGSVKEGLPRTALAPDDSFLQGYFSKFDASFESQTGIALEHHFVGFRHETPQAQARVFAAWGVFLNSPYVEEIATYAGQDGASSATNWLTAAVTAAAYMNVAAPCASLGVSAEVCALAAVPFGGLEVTGPDGPNLIPEQYFLTALDAAVAARPEIAAVLRRPADATSASGLGAPVSSVIVTRAVPVADDYPMQLRIYEDTIRCDEEVAWMFVQVSEQTNDGGVEAIADRTAVVTGADPTTSLPVTRSVAFDRPRAFTFQETLVYWQQDAVLWDELVLNLSLAGTGVFIVCVLALAHPAAVVAVAGVGVVDVFLFTTLVIGGLRFNVISVINFVMAVGLAVDYTLHFCHAFLAAPGLCRIERVQYTMQTMGSSILKGGGTTLAGTMPLAFSRSTIFRTFFALLFSTIVYGLAVGLILIPVVLSIAPLPAATHLHVEGVVPDLDQALDRVEALAESREEKKRGRSVTELASSA